MKCDNYSDHSCNPKKLDFCNSSLMNNVCASLLTPLHHCSSWIIYSSLHSSNSEQRFQQRLWEEGPVCHAQYSRGRLQNCAHCQPQPLPVQVSMFPSHWEIEYHDKMMYICSLWNG